MIDFGLGPIPAGEFLLGIVLVIVGIGGYYLFFKKED